MMPQMPQPGVALPTGYMLPGMGPGGAPWPGYPQPPAGYGDGTNPHGPLPGLGPAGAPVPPQLSAGKGLGTGGKDGGKGMPKGVGKGMPDDEDDDDDGESEYDDEDDSEGGNSQDMQHYADVCYSLMNYGTDAASEIQWKEKELKATKDPHDRALLMPVMTDALLQDMRRCAKLNSEFLAMLVRSDEDARRFAQIPATHVVQERNSIKVRTVLRQFVRDWAAEGAKERETQYGCLMDALKRFVPLGKPTEGSHASCCQGGRPRVLTPGSGLARLPYEVARLGYAAQGNEFSYHMLQGSKWVLNETSRPNMCKIYPFVLSLENRKGVRDHLRPVSIPDVCPSDDLCAEGELVSELSMCAGEFVEVYAGQEKAWDSVLTCFFLDTAKNVFLYIRTIAHIIRPGGLWANIGPLLYHYAEQPDSISIELSWEEVRPAIEKYFDFKEEDVREAYYTTNISGMFHTRYRCKYFAAIRNDRTAEGKSHAVFGGADKEAEVDVKARRRAPMRDDEDDL